MSKEKEKVLFICRNNSGRSQLAEGLLRHLYGDHYQVWSAGLDPRPINPLTLEVLEELGVDTVTLESEGLEKFMDQEFDWVVLLCAGEGDEYPVSLSAAVFIQKVFPDPRDIPVEGDQTLEEKLQQFRVIRDQIQNWVKEQFKPSPPPKKK